VISQPNANLVGEVNALTPVLAPDAKGVEAGHASSAHEQAVLTATGWASIAHIWRDALSAFVEHSAAILFCACIGFAGAAMLGAWVAAQLKPSNYARMGNVAIDGATPLAVLAGAIICVATMTFARSVITWMALQPSQPCEACSARGRFGDAIRATLARFPALLTGNLLYGMIVTAGIIAMSELTRPHEIAPGAMAREWAGPSRAFNDALRQLAWRGLNTATPDPGPPFADLMPHFRRIVPALLATSAPTVRLPIESGSAYGVERQPEFFEAYPTRVHPTAIWPLALGGIVLIFAAETLLRFRTIMVLKPPRSSRSRRFWGFAPLMECARFGMRHFGVITVHAWLLRLVLLGISLVFVIFPIVLSQSFVAPGLIRFTSSSWVEPTSLMLMSAGIALVGAIFTAFGVAYDAQLFKCLANTATKRHEERHATLLA
jgi:hypothetical protein